jgi:hypothetical protein
VTIYIDGTVAYTGFDTREDAERFVRLYLDVAPTTTVEIR